MAKLMIKCKQFWCFACNSKNVTLRKIKDVRICTECMKRLHKYGNAACRSGGKLVMMNGDEGTIFYVPSEEAGADDTE